MQQKQLFCKTCNQPRLYQRSGTHHLLHLIVTIVLFAVSAPLLGILGFVWLFIWALCTIFKQPYRCTQCGSRAGSSHLLAALLLGILIFLACAVMLGHGLGGGSGAAAEVGWGVPEKISVPENPLQTELESFNPYDLKLENLLQKDK